MGRGKLAKRRDDLLDHPRLKQREIKEWRDKLYEEQGNCCALCGLEIKEPSERVLDHCHSSGYIRGTLHRSCNAILGKVENNYKRIGVSDAIMLRAFGVVYDYICGSYSDKPYHPSHRTAEEKRLNRNEVARAKRAKKAARRIKPRI